MIERDRYQGRPEDALDGHDSILVTVDPALWPRLGDDMASAVAAPEALALDDALSLEAAGAWVRLLALSTGRDTRMYLSRAELLEALGFGETRWRRVAAELIGRGWITSEERRARGQYRGVRYVLHAEPATDEQKQARKEAR